MLKVYDEHQVWPPEEWQPIYNKYEEHAALYSGDAQMLADYYAKKVYTPAMDGRFWGRRVGGEVSTRIRVPIASDLAATSSDLLFSKPISISVDEAHEQNAPKSAIETQSTLLDMQKVMSIDSLLHEAGEYASALGGVYLKVNWDKELSKYPILSVAQADAAIPEFKFGILTGVTFWTVVEEEGKVVYRLLEQHVSGRIYNSLYKGNEKVLGKKIPLDYLPQTAGMPEEIDTGVKGLACRYIPNMKPNRMFRGANIGQSDFAGTEGLMEALDETYSSWMRDINLAKSRIIVPEEWIRPTETGGVFDLEREVYTTLDIDPTSMEKVGITMNQFAIRTKEHRETALELLDRIITHAGYSPQTFGLKIEGRAESGTALNIRERKTLITKEKKTNYWRSAIEGIFMVMQQIFNSQLGGKLEVYRPTVNFTPVHTDIETTAKTVQMLFSAQAATAYTRVKILHPDWSEERIKKEAEEIQKEFNNKAIV